MDPIKEIVKRRTAGRTTCVVMAGVNTTNEIAAADHVAQANGFQTLGENWIAISAADAHAIAITLLHLDLAYGEEVMPITVASDLATQLFDGVPEPHSYFTNGDWEVAGEATDQPATLRGWDPISDASFDSGVVCIGDGSAALLWVEDED